MDLKDKYKLALFGVIRNSTVMPAGVKLGKSMHEINTMSVNTMNYILDSFDYDQLEADFNSVAK
jgi:hypothetical protein